MKKLLVLFPLLLLSIAAHCQFNPPPIDSTRGKIVYAAIIQVPGVSQAELYKRALQWFVRLVPHTTTDPAIKDAATGTLAARVALPFTARAVVGSLPSTLWREVSISVKEGRVKYDISDFEVQSYVASPTNTTPPTTAQAKLTPAEEYLNHAKAVYYTKQGEPKAYVASILSAISEQTAVQVSSLKAALAKSNDW